ncbi:MULTISPECIES: SemiSWEET family transporter [Neisseria]|jgi:integral membrane protein|uniref:MtN3/saliva family protein n=4 Tax=Neisseriaceae TaxID=481 RepID=D0W637_NEICI|nr:SemiSWEET family transporter [Neisseria lactamica]EEZ70731.1 hypothetical protein NEICINOT_05164 [Neisseria cinerea ATCC 14685]
MPEPAKAALTTSSIAILLRYIKGRTIKIFEKGYLSMISKKKFNAFIGSIGAAIGIFVFIAYIPQIIANLEGEKAQPWQPLFAAVSCLIWVLYGWSKEPKKDWILIVPNAVGVILGSLTFLTAL